MAVGNQILQLRFRSKHSYSHSTIGIEVPIELICGGEKVEFAAKIDTGSQFCIFQRQFAEELGLVLEAGDLRSVSTVTGSFRCYGHSVVLRCLDHEFEAHVYFAESETFPRNVVGREGWLRQFRIAILDEQGMLLASPAGDE
jgi:hypothetical protein